MPRPEEKPPTEGKIVVINEIIAENEMSIKEHEKQIEKLVNQVNQMKKLKSLLNKLID